MLRVSVHYTKKAKKIASYSPEAFKAIQRPVRVLTATAKHIEKRMRRGKTATKNKGYLRSQKRSYVVSADYARAAGVPEGLIGSRGRSDRARFESSAAFHKAANVREGTFRTTGGMWKGLQVKNLNKPGKAAIDFRGSSMTSRVRFGRTAKGKARNKPPNVRNYVKAAVVYNRMRINVIQPTDDEIAAWVDVVTVWASDAVRRNLGAIIEPYHPSGNRRLYKAILRTGTRR
jgi:hypothetical protein